MVKIVVAGGDDEADFLIGLLKAKGNTIVAINDDCAMCERLASVHDIRSVWGDPTKRYVLEGARIDGFDLIIALMEIDAEKLVACQMASRFFSIERSVCTVTDPENASIFKRFGIDHVISSVTIVSDAVEDAFSEGHDMSSPTIPEEGGLPVRSHVKKIGLRAFFKRRESR